MQKKLYKLIICVNLIVLPFISPQIVHASDTDDLDERIQQVIQQYGLDDSSFSVAYYDLVSGESYEWNGRKYMFTASVYKLPLNMYYYMMENAGEIDSHAVVGGYDLANAHYLSIVLSDNDASDALKDGLGSYSYYKNQMFLTFGSAYYQDLNNIDPSVYEDVYYPADYLIDVLKYLYQNQSSFQELLSYMSAEEQRNGFDNTLKDRCTVYQKQGWYETVNTVAEIVDADEPYLAVIMLDHNGGALIAQEVNEVLYDYHESVSAPRLYLKEKKEQEEEDRISTANEVMEVSDEKQEGAGVSDEGTNNENNILLNLFGIIAASVPVCGLYTVFKQ